MLTSIDRVHLNEKIYVDDFLIDLVPNFIAGKKEEISRLQDALDKKDFSFIKKIGHNWKGVCSSYGFNYLAEVGKQFEVLADRQDVETLRNLLNSIPQYLDSAQIVALPEDHNKQQSHQEF